MLIKQAKQDAESSEEEEPYWPDDESEDEDFGSDLESNGSCASYDWDRESITCDELRLLAADLVSEDEEGGATGEARCVYSFCLQKCPPLTLLHAQDMMLG
jgi:hypothetical protein